jgi:hypothetical protein
LLYSVRVNKADSTGNISELYYKKINKNKTEKERKKGRREGELQIKKHY